MPGNSKLNIRHKKNWDMVQTEQEVWGCFRSLQLHITRAKDWGTVSHTSPSSYHSLLFWAHSEFKNLKPGAERYTCIRVLASLLNSHVNFKFQDTQRQILKAELHSKFVESGRVSTENIKACRRYKWSDKALLAFMENLQLLTLSSICGRERKSQILLWGTWWLK